MLKNKHHTGFTLLEVAIVIVIMGLLSSALLPPLSVRIDVAKNRETRDVLREVKSALLGYAVLNRRLPCPDSNNDGLEDINAGVCISQEGWVPWADLGTGHKDSWQNSLRYRPDAEYAARTLNTATPNGFSTTSRLAVKTVDTTGYCDSSPVDELSLSASEGDGSSRIVALIFSYGSNSIPDNHNADSASTPCGSVTAGTAETTYAQNKLVYAQDRNEAGRAHHVVHFDDSLIWISKNLLLQHLAAAGVWSPVSE